MKEQKKWAYILPNTFTSLNLACGFAAIILSTRAMYYEACLVLGLGALFDSVDGRIARMTGTQSPFGEQFDSMSDMVSFGVAPAVLVYFNFLHTFGRLGMVISFIFALCAAMRLARFNVNIDKVHSDYFQGLPVPGAALGVVGLVLFAHETGGLDIASYVALPYVFIYATLMISNIPFPAFKKSEWLKGRRKYVLVCIISVLLSLFVYGEIVIGVVISLYIIGSIIYFLTHRGRFQDIFQWEEESEGA